jgi:hypothetical protein
LPTGFNYTIRLHQGCCYDLSIVPANLIALSFLFLVSLTATSSLWWRQL